MKLIYYDKKSGEALILIESVEDLWHLEKILTEGDLVEGRSFRVFKQGGKEEKKPVTLRLRVQKTSFSKYANRLRVLGVIEWGKPEEFVQLGRHHTLELSPGDKVKVVKEWKGYHLERIREAERAARKVKALIVLIDEEKAQVAEVRVYGVEFGPVIYNRSSKRSGVEERERFYDEVLSCLEGKTIIVAGPGFEKERFKKHAEERGYKVILESASTVERSGIIELLKRRVIEKTLGEVRAERELAAVEEALEEIYKERNATYGLEEVKKAAEYGAVKKLLVLDQLLRSREEVEKVADMVEKQGGEILIISAEGEAGERLKGFGCLVALLRFKVD